MKNIFAFLAFILLCFKLLVNTDPTTGNIFTQITRTIPEPIALLLFGSVLIGLANAGRKKFSTKRPARSASAINPRLIAYPPQLSDLLRALHPFPRLEYEPKSRATVG